MFGGKSTLPLVPVQWIRAAARFLIIVLAVSLNVTAASGQPLQSWEGINVPDFLPLDIHGAPGSAGILATVERRIQYFTKAGATVWGPLSLEAFCSHVGPSNLKESKVIFDHDSRRFFVTIGEAIDSHFWLNVAVSRSSDPRTGGGEDWIFYRFDATKYSSTNPEGGVNYGGAIPGLAVDGQALYVTYNMYPFQTDGDIIIYQNGVPSDAVLLIMNKSRMIDGTGVLSPPFSVGYAFSHWEPVTPFGAGPGNVIYLIQSYYERELRIAAIVDPLGARTPYFQPQLFVTDFGEGDQASGAPQLNSTQTVDLQDVRLVARPVLTNASLVAGDIWICATRGTLVIRGGTGRWRAAWYRLRLNGWPFSGEVNQAEAGTVGEDSDWNFCPAIGVNKVGDVCMTWTRCSASTYPTMMRASRNAGDTAFGAPQVVKVSDHPFAGGGPWGTWATVWPDPVDGSMWIANEWVSGFTPSTWWAQIGVPASNFYVDRSSPSPTELGTLAFPYHTVTKAVDASTHGTIHIAGGHYNEILTIRQATTVITYNGTVLIGAP